jgi:hypothetical protein
VNEPRFEIGDRVERASGSPTGRGTVVGVEQKPDVVLGFIICVKWDEEGPRGRFYHPNGLRLVSVVDQLAALGDE